MSKGPRILLLKSDIIRLTVFATIVITIYVVAVYFTPKTEYSELEMQHQHYCEMVQIFKSSGGEYGWPPYKGECNE